MVIKSARINFMLFSHLRVFSLSTGSLRPISSPVSRPFGRGLSVPSSPSYGESNESAFIVATPTHHAAPNQEQMCCGLRKLNPRITDLAPPHDRKHGHPSDTVNTLLELRISAAF